VTTPTPPSTPGGLAAQADVVEAAVLAVPGVTALHGGAHGEVAVHLPGRRVSGVRLREGRTEVHVVLELGRPVGATAAAVQDAVARVRPGPVDVTVEDVTDPRPAVHREPVVAPGPDRPPHPHRRTP